MNFIKINLSSFLVAVIILFAVGACELIDPTEVSNPAITQEKLFADATGGAAPLITGLRRAFADAVTRTCYFTDIVSDNYVNTSTYLSTTIDDPRMILPSDQYLSDIREIYGKLQALHALATFGLDVVLPADAQSTPVDKAEALFYKAMAIIMLSENFQAFPLVESGPSVRSADAIKIAIQSLSQAYQLNSSGEFAIRTKLALARAYRLDKNKTAASQAAAEALAMDQQYIFDALFDAINLPNLVTTFTVTRSFNDMQPLPRLDFLDPKYTTRDGSDPIASLKGEEAYLIIAEAAISNSDFSTAKLNLNAAIDLANSRATISVVDRDPRRNRPNNSAYTVKSDQASPAISGLIFKRSGSTIVNHLVSGTSLTSAYINSLSTKSDLYYALYLLRQEIFFSEGRRMSDLGIRLPVMQREIDTNPNFSAGSYGTVVSVPSYIPQSTGMDAFTMDATNLIVTIQNDMNKILVQNIAQVSPF